jgi:predicted O-methyltransferase YrrM
VSRSAALASRARDHLRSQHLPAGAALRIEGGVGEREVELLYRLASGVPSVRVIVEVGSYRGRSSIALGLGSLAGNGAPVYAVDPHEDFVGVLGVHFGWRDRETFMRNVVRTHCAKVIRLINLPSVQVARLWERPVGLLFLDGDHHYESVRADIEAWAPHLVDGAAVALDESNDRRTGVPRLIEDDLLPGGWRCDEVVGRIMIVKRS